MRRSSLVAALAGCVLALVAGTPAHAAGSGLTAPSIVTTTEDFDVTWVFDRPATQASCDGQPADLLIDSVPRLTDLPKTASPDPKCIVKFRFTGSKTPLTAGVHTLLVRLESGSPAASKFLLVQAGPSASASAKPSRSATPRPSSAKPSAGQSTAPGQVAGTTAPPGDGSVVAGGTGDPVADEGTTGTAETSGLPWWIYATGLVLLLGGGGLLGFVIVQHRRAGAEDAADW